MRHPSAGGSCEREAATIVYGLLFCEEHGVEATVGALTELYRDGCDFVERTANPHTPLPNVEATRALEATWRELLGNVTSTRM